MIRKTKKGARRLREMPVLQRGVFVATEYVGGRRHITPGKAYRKDENSMWSFGITNDAGRSTCIRYPGSPCAHLNYEGVWNYTRAYR